MELTLVYDGGCPFCSAFAQRAELQGGLPELVIRDGRSDHALRSELTARGYRLANGAILLEGDRIWHGSAAIAELNRRMIPSDSLLKLLKQVFRDEARSRALYPALLLARRLALAVQGRPVDPDHQASARVARGRATGLRSNQVLQICLSIDPEHAGQDPSVPDALSHHQLSALLKAAMQSTGNARPGPQGAEIGEDELLRAALSAWADQTKELLQWIEQQGDSVSESRSPKQVMALGSFRTHLVMGLKALRYAES